MLNQVPRDVNKAARQVTLKHPNSMDIALFRKVVERTAPTQIGGLPTLGGLGVLTPEDESEVDWTDLGYGKMLIVERFQPSEAVNRGDAIDLSYPELLALIQPVEEPSTPGSFTVQRYDVAYVFFGDDVKIAYEVARIEGDVLINPYAVKYVLQKRDMLSYIAGFPPN